MPVRLLVTACLASWLVAFARPAAQSNVVLVFEHANVIPMDSERVIRDAQVWVSKGTVVTIASSADGRDAVANPGNVVRIDGRGKFLMPALAEMHAHMPNDPAEAERVLFMCR